MKTIKILTLGALAVSMSFAAEASSVTPVDQCRLALDNAKTNLPSMLTPQSLRLPKAMALSMLLKQFMLTTTIPS